MARCPRRSGVCRGVVASGRAEAGAPLVLALGLGVTVVPAFAPPGWTPAACVDLQQVWPSTSSSAPPQDFSNSLARASTLTSSCLLDVILRRCGPPDVSSSF
uniref:Uncharacterized protein n=1 Tax=Oryza rufipogon TaxID=4529 RepID=A0A0E0QXP8_ORYRU